MIKNTNKLFLLTLLILAPALSLFTCTKNKEFHSTMQPAAADGKHSSLPDESHQQSRLVTDRTAQQLEREKELAKQAEFFVDLYLNYSPFLSGDNRKLAFVSNREGISQVYVKDVADASKQPTRISDISQRALAPVISSDSKMVFYISDTGGDEKYRIFAAGTDGSPPQCLTPEGELWRDSPLITKDGTKMIYTASELKETRTIVYIQPTKPCEPKEVFRIDKKAFLTDITNDGSKALVIAVANFSDIELFVVDTTNGNAKKLFPPEGRKAGIFAAVFRPDGKEIFISTDNGEERALIMKLDSSTGQIKGVYQEIEQPRGFFGSLSVMSMGKLLFAQLNLGDHNELRVIETKKLGLISKPQIPMKNVIVANYCYKDSNLCPVIVSAPATPYDIYIFDIKKGTFTPVETQNRENIEKLPRVITQIVKVPSTDSVEVPVIISYPVEEVQKSRVPVIISMHGGPQGASKINWQPERMFYLSLGYAFVEPNVRGSTGFGRDWEMADDRKGRMKAVEDMGAVARWVSKQSWADPEKLIVYGGSYGGYMVLMGLAFQPEIWAAGIDFFGISSMKTLINSTSGVIRDIAINEFGDPEKDSEWLDYISPLNHINSIVAPLFVYQGANDQRVPKMESEQIVKALINKGIKVEYMLVGNEGHSMDRRENRIEFLSRTARFLEEVFTERKNQKK